MKALFLCYSLHLLVFFCHIKENNDGLHVLQIELRKRVVLPKESNTTNRIGAQPEPERAREAVNMRREKRGGMRVTFSFPSLLPYH